MEKKRSKGVTIFGIIETLLGIQGTMVLLNSLFSFNSVVFIVNIASGPLFLVLGIGMLNLKPFARKVNLFLIPMLSLTPLIFIIVSILNSLDYQVKNNIKVGLWTVGQGWGTVSIGLGIIFILIILAINSSLAYFLTRPKVKEQFSAEGGSPPRRTGASGGK